MNKKIVIKGSYGESNFGDDLLMCVLENFFLEKFTNHTIVFMGKENDYVNKLLKKSNFINTNKEIQSDILVYGGGTQFFAFEKETNFYFALIRNFFHLVKTDRIKLYNLVLKKISLRKYLTTVKVLSIGIGVGPFNENRRAEKSTVSFLKNSNFLAVRDQISLDYCKKWGLKNVSLGADICFSSYFDTKLFNNDKIGNDRKKKKIGIIVRDWNHDKQGRAYYSSLLKYAEICNNDNEVNIQFIIFAPKKDLEWIKILKGRNVLYWDPCNMSIPDFFSKMNDFDSFISSRYHGAIFGALLGKPVICIEIEPKLRILTNQIKELYLWEKPFCINALMLLTPVLLKSVNYEKSISNLRALSNDMFSEFEQYLKQI